MKHFIVFLLMATCLGCSKFASNGEQLYLMSKNGVLPVVNPPLTKENISYFYELPPQPQNAQISIEPPLVARNQV